MKKLTNILFFVILIISFIFLFNNSGGPRIFINLMTFAGIYGLAAIGINVHFGWTGLLNFGHAAFIASSYSI